MKKTIGFLFTLFFLVFFQLNTAHATAMTFTLNWDSGPLSINNEDYGLYHNFEYIAYYDSDNVSTQNTTGEFGWPGFVQTVSVDYWELYLSGERIFEELNGTITYDNADPTIMDWVLFSSNTSGFYSETTSSSGMNLITEGSHWISDIFFECPSSIGNIKTGDGWGTFTIETFTIETVSVPEPDTIFLLILGFIGICCVKCGKGPLSC